MNNPPIDYAPRASITFMKTNAFFNDTKKWMWE